MRTTSWAARFRAFTLFLVLLLAASPVLAGPLSLHMRGRGSAPTSYPQKVLDTGTEVAYDSRTLCGPAPGTVFAAPPATSSGIDNTFPYFSVFSGTHTLDARHFDGYLSYVYGGGVLNTTNSWFTCPSSAACSTGFGFITTGEDAGISPSPTGSLSISHGLIDDAGYRVTTNQAMLSFGTGDTLSIDHSCLQNAPVDYAATFGTLSLIANYVKNFGTDPACFGSGTHAEAFHMHGPVVTIQDNWFAQDQGGTFYCDMTGILFGNPTINSNMVMLVERNIFTQDGTIPYPLVVHGNGTVTVTFRDNLIQVGPSGKYIDTAFGLASGVTCIDGGGNRDWDTGNLIPTNLICSFLFAPFAPRRRRYDAANDNEGARKIAA